jgi:hypothetical protein
MEPNSSPGMSTSFFCYEVDEMFSEALVQMDRRNHISAYHAASNNRWKLPKAVVKVEWKDIRA